MTAEAMRSYTVNEIRDLRAVIENKFLWGRYAGPSAAIEVDGYAWSTGPSIAYVAREKDAYVEDRVRTHMLAGHRAVDLLASEK